MVNQALTVLRRKYYALRTEKTYLNRIRRCMRFLHKRYPMTLDEKDIETFFNNLVLKFGQKLILVRGGKWEKDRITVLPETLIDQQIEDYLNDLDENDELEAEVHKPTAEEIQEKIDSLKERKGKLGKLLDELEESGKTQVSFTRSLHASGAKPWHASGIQRSGQRGR